MNRRERLLINLIEASDGVDSILSDLRKLPWDSETALVTLTRPDMRRIVTRYLEGKLTADELESWANAIESREDIKYEIGYEDVLGEVIHQLANPLLTFPLSLSTAHEIIEIIR